MADSTPDLQQRIAALEKQLAEVERERDACITAVEIVAANPSQHKLIKGRIAVPLSRLARTSYPHMCADDHERIGHSDSEHEQCPLCRANDRAEAAEALVGEAKRLMLPIAHSSGSWSADGRSVYYCSAEAVRAIAEFVGRQGK